MGKRNTAKKSKQKLSRGKNIFYWSILAFPILQFCIFYLGVNINSFALAFQEFDYEGSGFKFLGFDKILTNFGQVIKNFKEMPYLQNAFKNSVIVFLISLLVGLTLALLFSYYIYKKCLLNKTFRILLFLPYVISSITLVIIYKYFAEQALPEIINKVTGIEIEGLLSNPKTELAAIMIFTIWTSFGM